MLAGLPLGAFCSFAYITGHFCNTDWGDGAGVLFEQSITLFHTCLQSMNGKPSFFFFLCRSCSPLQLGEQMSYCP